jgi:TIR domain
VTNDQTEYELFIPYARRDDRPIPETYPHGWVTALKDHIIADHRLYETSPLRIFFDTHEIRDMDDWQDRVPGALRRSKVLLICVSPNYVASLPCRWEWEEYQARQAHSKRSKLNHSPGSVPSAVTASELPVVVLPLRLGWDGLDGVPMLDDLAALDPKQVVGISRKDAKTQRRKTDHAKSRWWAKLTRLMVVASNHAIDQTWKGPRAKFANRLRRWSS